MRTARPGAALVSRTMSRNVRPMLVGSVLAGVSQAAATSVPIAIGVIVDRAVDGGSLGALALSVGALGAIFLIQTISWQVYARAIVEAILEEAHRLRVELVGRILHPNGVDTGLRAGETLTVATSDADQAAEALEIVPWVFGAAVATTIAAVSLLRIDPWLGIGVAVGAPALVVCLQLWAPTIAKYVRIAQAATARTSGTATDLISGMRPLKGLGAEAEAVRRYSSASRAALGDAIRVANVSGLYEGVSRTASSLVAVTVSAAAGWFALTGDITVGELITAVGLAQFVIGPVGSVSRAPMRLAQSRGSFDRVAIVLNAPLVIQPGRELVTSPSITLRGVNFRSLSDLDLVVDRGALVAVVALDSSYGTDLVELLSSHTDPDSYIGEVVIGDVLFAEAELASIRSTLLVEPHESDLFTGSLRSNIEMGVRTDVDNAKQVIAKAIEYSDTTGVVDAHSAGLDHPVVDRGMSLSGGQRQRLALARALVAQSPILVLHDPTTAVDTITEQTMAAGIAAARRPGTAQHTTIMVTSSPTLLGIADRVFVLGDGHVVAEGTHEELIVTHDVYREAVQR